MDPEQTFIRVQERLSEMLPTRVRDAVEYTCLFTAIILFSVLVFMHANYVQQPGCSSELSGVETADAQIIQIKITSAGLWSQDEPEAKFIGVANREVVTDRLEVSNEDEDVLSRLTVLAVKFWSAAKQGKLALKFWKTNIGSPEYEADSATSSQRTKPIVDDALGKIEKEEQCDGSAFTVKETFSAAIIHFGNKWQRCRSFIWGCATQITGSLWKIAGIHLNLYAPKWLHILHVLRRNLHAVIWPEKGSEAFEPTYLYTTEKGYFFLPEEAKTRHNIRTANISISPQHSCFGNRWQQLLINWFVGYDTILMNSILDSPGEGYLYNHQTKDFYDLSHAHDPPESPARFGDYLVMKCGVLMMSLFVFFTTTMSVSFTLRETQTRMLNFTVQLQHHARHRLPTFQLTFVHVIESLVFVPIMIGILFFLFEFYDDQLLAFMVLVLVWLCELFTLVSARTPISMKFFPRFFLLYFLIFHIYFFSYPYGFSYLALSTTIAFMQHLILYFWNRFEVPALQRFLHTRRSQAQQHQDFHITASTILASTLHITRLNTTNPSPPLNTDARPGPGPVPDRPGQASAAGEHAEPNPNPGAMSSFSSMLLWILGGASSEGLNTFLSMFRDVRDQDRAFDEARSEAEASIGTS